MTIKDFKKLVERYDDDTEVGLLVWDGNDNWDVDTVSVNEYDSGVDIEFILKDVIIEKIKDNK